MNISSILCRDSESSILIVSLGSYSTRDEVMDKSKIALMAIPQTDYKKCFEDWIKR